MTMDKRVLDSLGVLYSDVVTTKRFKHWKEDHRPIANMMDDCIFGEIFWRKAMGRPKTANLSSGVRVDSWRTTRILNGTPSGVTSIWLNVPHSPSWWDGKDDGEYWRVNYLISHIPDGHRHDPVFGDFEETTFIVPQFENVPWDVPGGKLGIGNAGMRVFEPRDAAFVKTPGAAHVSFEIVPRILLKL